MSIYCADTGKANRPLHAHIWDRNTDDWYVEPEWCSRRLFEEEQFEGAIWDPACGLGRIVRSAIDAGHAVRASDIEFRQSTDDEVDDLKAVADFRTCTEVADNIVTNPPFNIARQFVLHALALARNKVAVVFPTASLNAAAGPKKGRWIVGTPLRRVWLMSPRPSMPPGHVLAAGGKPSGGKVDYAWLVWEHGYTGATELRWLHQGCRP
jgi:hypothetical protein